MQPLSANQITQIAELSVTKSPSEISKELGIPRQTVYRRLAKDSTKRLIEIIQHDYIHEALPEASDNMLAVIQDGKELKPQQFKASERVLESAGVLNTQTPSIYVQQIFQSNQITLSPILQGVINQHLKEMDVIDVGVENHTIGSKDVQTTDIHDTNPDNSYQISRNSVGGQDNGSDHLGNRG